jgi:hypothetical protein
MSTTDNFIDNYLANYNDAYDDQDRYGDFIYDFYETIGQYAEDRSICLLNRNNFDDFFSFCVEHINTEVVDNEIQTREITRLQREIGHLKNFVEEDDIPCNHVQTIG